jgi:lambda repressor-like predicted transcriptional regulator
MVSNPPEAIETVATQGFAATHGCPDRVESTPNTVPESTHRPPPEERGRLSNPIQRHLSPTDINELIAAYHAGATINELAHRYRLHRTTVAVTFDRHHVERHRAQGEWTSETLAAAADFYATGLSLAAVAARYGIDPQTVANRFRRARIPTRPRRGWPPRRPT